MFITSIFISSIPYLTSILTQNGVEILSIDDASIKTSIATITPSLIVSTLTGQVLFSATEDLYTMDIADYLPEMLISHKNEIDNLADAPL